MMTIRMFPSLIILLVGIASLALAQSLHLSTPKLERIQSASPTLPNNSISHLANDGSIVYVGTSKGLARTTDGGGTWESFRSVPAFVNDGIFSLAVRSDIIWTATGFNKRVEGEENRTVQTGSGYTYSLDAGRTWTHVPQTLDAPDDSIVMYGSNRIKFLPIIVPEQNVTFDLAFNDSVVWIASWASGLRKSTNRGASWQRTVLPSDTRNSIAPDDPLSGYVVDPRRNNNFLAFAVYLQNDSTIWCGTAGGINRSTDGGVSWTKFSAQNQVAHILGNWVIAIDGQPRGSHQRIWCTNWRADDPNEQFGISSSDDDGRIWRTFLHGIKAYDFAFKDSIVYVATDDGIFRSADAGETWTQSGTIIDRASGNRFISRQFFSVDVVADTVYCGGSEGLAKTIDNAAHAFGETWQVLRAFRRLGTTGTTYAYPNPFSPKQEFVRLHYSTNGRTASVTIEVFDFGMNRVRTVIKDAQRSGTNEHDEIWDGRDDADRQVANGVYFYRVTTDGAEPSWGKVMVLQ